MRLKKTSVLFTDGNWIESKDQSTNEIRLLQTGNIGKGIFLDKSDRAKYISEETFKRLKCTEVLPGDLIISRLPDPIGRACIVPNSGQKMITAVDCTIYRINPELVSKEYANYFLMSNLYFHQITNNVKGTTRKRISRKNLENIEFPITNKSTQNNIVEKLNLVRRLIDIYSKELTKLDKLIKARFVELFGDLTTNNRGWKTENFSCVFENITSSKRILKSEWKSNGIPFLRVRDLVQLSEKEVLNNEFFISSELYSRLSDNDGVPKNGDILVSATSTLGKCHIVNSNEKLYFKDADVLRFRPSNKINAVYFTECMNDHFIQGQIEHNLGVTTVKHFTIKAAKSILIRIPPLSLQNEFANFVQQVDKSKVAVQKSLNETQILFDSLMQKYFG